MIEVEVKSSTVLNAKEYQGKRYGNQRAGLHNGGDFAVPFDVYVEEANPYPKGRYLLDPRSFVVDENNRLGLKRIKLLPLAGKSGL